MSPDRTFGESGDLILSITQKKIHMGVDIKYFLKAQCLMHLPSGHYVVGGLLILNSSIPNATPVTVRFYMI